MNRVWVPGWQASSSCFDAVFAALGVPPEPVLIFEQADHDRTGWLEAQVKRLPENCTLVGWSLGGMLAYELAQICDRVGRVWMINSNVQFAGGPGLNEGVADAFLQRYKANPSLTRKKFAALVDRDHIREVQSFLLDGDHLTSLQWLYDIRIDKTLNIPVRALLAQNDALVPCETAAAAWQALTADVTVVEGQHSLPLKNSELVSQWVRQGG